MKENYKKSVKNIVKCLCGLKSKTSVDFRKFPITETFLNKFKISKKYYFDQKINFCESCGHIFLGKQINSKHIYNSNSYLFSSSQSYSAIHANDTFFEFINANINKKIKHDQIIELGSNDLYLLKKFYKTANKLIGIDPVVKVSKKFKKIKTIKNFFGKEVIDRYLNKKSDIIICGHTLEHVENVDEFIKNTLSICSENTKIFFQFPSSESLIQSNSFDQLHHQHLNLFSLKSFKSLLEKHGGKLIDFKFNNLHYGALMVFFTLKKSKIKPKNIKIKNKFNLNFKNSYNNFKNHLSSYKMVINNYLKLKKKFYVIGAGLMLPLINYHLDNLMNKADGILDDDKRKIGKFFPGINSKISSLKNADVENSVCLIAPVASTLTCRKLVEILKDKKAETILLPTITF